MFIVGCLLIILSVLLFVASVGKSDNLNSTRAWQGGLVLIVCGMLLMLGSLYI